MTLVSDLAFMMDFFKRLFFANLGIISLGAEGHKTTLICLSHFKLNSILDTRKALSQTGALHPLECGCQLRQSGFLSIKHPTPNPLQCPSGSPPSSHATANYMGFYVDLVASSHQNLNLGLTEIISPDTATSPKLQNPKANRSQNALVRTLFFLEVSREYGNILFRRFMSYNQ